MKIILEPRYLFDASLAATTKHATDAAHAVGNDADGRVHAHAAPPDGHTGANTNGANPGTIDTHAAPTAPSPAAATVSAAATASNTDPHEILFVDPRVANWESLTVGLKTDVEVIVIDPTKDGIAQVTQALSTEHNVTAINFLTYGSSGQIELGNSMITDASLLANQSAVASWADHLAPGGDILFWGCNVGEGSAGAAFMQDLHTLTGAQIAASTDATGASALGGNWVLEASTGHIDAATPFSDQAMASYQGVLDTATPVVTLSQTSSVLLGGTFTETATFQNTASSGVGFGPFIDLFVPHNTAQSASLTSATFLGSSVTYTAVTLSTTVTGHAGVLGALEPYAFDVTGAPLFVQAPTGYVVGDTLYAIQLPFGSYTPGEPAANIVLTFAVTNTSELSSSHGNQPLVITAEGGYEYGTDPLNNPTTDPSLRGTGASATLTDAADGAVSTNTSINLITVSGVTDLHEAETATGPDYPFNYIITLTPAPAVATDAITGFDFTFHIPGQVQYTGGTIAIAGSTGTITTTPSSTTPGTDLVIHFNSLTAASSISIPVFVPLKDSSNAYILNPTTGAAQTIALTPSYSYTGSWNPLPGSLDHLAVGTTAISGDSVSQPISVSFTAKSLAIQISDSSGGVITPGQVVTETINFQVSDYFSLNNLKIQDLLGDGMTLLAPGDTGYATPTLSVTRGGVTTGGISFTDDTALTPFTFAPPAGSGVSSETVAESGTNAYWNYTRDDVGTGTTTTNFLVGALLANQFGGTVGSVLQGSNGTGATTGTITYKAKVLDWYTNTNSQQSLREKDSTSNTLNTAAGTTTADVVTVTTVGGISAAVPTGSTITDGSGLTDAVPYNTLGLSIVDVNGAAYVAGTIIQAGDTVTYELNYTLTAGSDYGNLTLSSYVPLPVFDASDPLSTGVHNSVTSFTDGTATAGAPVAGAYKVIALPAAGGAVTGNSVNATANSITFNLGTLDDPANTANQHVTIDFSVKASNKPFADGLFLTNQGASTDTNAHTTTFAAAAINQVVLGAPELVTKTGIVSLVNDANANKPASAYSVDTTNPTVTLGTPSAATAPSGAGGSPFNLAMAAGLLTGAGTPLNAIDLNVTGADGSDTARIVTTVENTGKGNAYDVTVNGTLPTGYAVGAVNNFAVYDSNGNAVTFTKADGVTAATAADYFSTGGIMINPTGNLANNGLYYVVYDLALSSTQLSGSKLAATGTTVNWASKSGGVAGGNGFVSGAAALGVSAAALTDNATIGITAPTVVKTVIAASDTTDVPLTAANNVVPGETVQYQLTVTIPEGSTANAGADVTIADTLPTGMNFVSLDTITYNNVTQTGGTVTANGTPESGQSLSIHLGQTLTNNANGDTPETVVITYTAQVATTAGAGTKANSAVLTTNGTPGTPATVNVTVATPGLLESISVADSGTPGTPLAQNATVYSGENLTYTVKLVDNGNAPAQSLVYYIEVPNAVLGSISAGSLVGGGVAVNPVLANLGTVGTNTIFEITADKLPVSATGESFTFTATVNNNLSAGTGIKVDTPQNASISSGGNAGANPSGLFYSLPAAGGVPQGKQYADYASTTLTTGAFAPTLKIIGESNNTAGLGTSFTGNSQTSVNATIGDIIRYSAYVQVPEGQNSGLVTVTLPKGVTFADVTNDNIDVLLVSPTGVLTGTNVAAGAQASYTGTYDPTIAVASTPLDSSHISSSTNGAGVTTVTFDLGILTDNEVSSKPNYLVLQFNGIVANAAGITTALTPALSSTVSIGGLTSSNATVNVKEPTVTLSKTISSVVNGVITYSETLTNTGNAAAYNVIFDDPEPIDHSNIGAISNLTAASTGTVSSLVTNNTGIDLNATMTLSAGASETYTYTITAINPAVAVPNSTATVHYTSLSTPNGETLLGTTTGATGTASGSRDGTTTPTSLDTYFANATTGLGVVSGRVWNDLGTDNTSFTAGLDTALAGVTVKASFAGTGGTVTETATTAADGTYSVLVPNGSIAVALPASGAGGLGATETLVYDNGAAVVAPAGATVTASSTVPVTGINFSYQTPDTPPAVAGWGGTLQTYTEGGAAIKFEAATGAAATSVADTQLDAIIANGTQTIHDYSGTQLVVQRYASVGGATAANATDVFGGDGGSNLTLAGGNVTFNGTTLGTYTQAGGVLTITFGTGSTTASVQNVLAHLTYSDGQTTNLTPKIVIGATLYDGNTNATHYQGTQPNNTSTPIYATLNVSPALSATFNEPNNGTTSASAVAIVPTLVLNAPAAGATTYTSAAIQITGNPQVAEDVLSFSGGAAYGNITGTFNAATDTLTLSSAGHTATLAQWQAAINAVTYYSSSDRPNNGDRAVSITLTDGAGVTSPTQALTTIHVIPANDSPVLGAATGVSLTPVAAAVTSAPVGAVGTLISALVGNGTGPSDVTDTDDAGAINGGAITPPGVAITGADVAHGNWYYSLDGGTTWIEFATTGTTISDTNALHLASTARIYFQPNDPTLNGTIPAALSFRAWDQFDGVASGTLSALPASLGTGINTAGSSYSSATDTLPLAITGVQGNLGLSLIGESNLTSGQGTANFSSQSFINATVGDVVRLTAYVSLPEGTNTGIVLNVALPTGLSYQGGATVLLASPNGDFASTTLDPAGNTATLQVAEGATAINTTTAVATYVLPGADINTATPGHVQFNFGNLTNNDLSTVRNFAIVQFNAIVTNTVGDVSGTNLNSTLTVGGTTSSPATVTINEPRLTLAKTATISGTTVTYTETVTNTGNATAYNIALDDPQPIGAGPITGLVSTGPLVVTAAHGNGSSDLQETGTLAAGATQTITYSVTASGALPSATATATYTSLSTASETLAGTSTGATGTLLGTRDGVTAPTSLNNYIATVTTSFGIVSGRLWNDISSDDTRYQEPGSHDTPLAGVTVTDGNGNTTVTDASGYYSFVEPSGSTTISVPTPGHGGLAANETQVYTDGLNFVYRTPDTAPVISNWGGTIPVSYVAGGSPVVLSSVVPGVADTQLDSLGGNYGNTILTVQRYNSAGTTAAPDVGDNFTGSGTLALNGGGVTLGGTNIGSFTESGGVLSITFGSGTTAAQVGQVLDQIAYSNGTATNLLNGVKIGVTLNDGNTTGIQGTGGALTGNISIATVNITSTPGVQTFIEPNNTPAIGQAVTVDGTLTLGNPTGAYSQAVVQISGNFVAGEDVLTLAWNAGTGNIAGSYNAATGVLTLSSAGNSASAAQWTAALDSVQYYDSKPVPNTADRTVTISVTDSSGSVAAAPPTTIHVLPTNNSPLLDTTVAVSLTQSVEDISGAPVGAVGTLVSNLVGNSNVTDPDGANAHDGSALVPTGIAVDGANTTYGNWYYSLNGGSTWTEFAGTGISGSISDANALHLSSTARIYFQPTTPNFNGAVPNALSFRAWDQFDGAANGSLSSLTALGTLGTGRNTAGSAYSANVDVVPLPVIAVNDAPIASGTVTLPSPSEDSTPTGSSIASLFGGNFSDTADQQKTVGNPTGSVANTLAGIAITGDAATSVQGVWQYSTNGGTNWVAIPANVSDSNALVLPQSALLRFLPTGNYNGVVGQLTTRLIDSSIDVPITGTVTGLTLSSGTTAYTGIDVSGNHDGGSTAVSAASVPLTTSVIAVNDAPIASGTASLPPVSATVTSPPGDTIAHLFSGNFSDQTDQQFNGTTNPTGSIANTLAGVAIIGNQATSSQGSWQYSNDGGTTWISIPISVTNRSAIDLPATSLLRFLPSRSFSGTPGSLSVVLIDSSGGSITPASNVDVSLNGGITPLSASAVPLSTSVTAATVTTPVIVTPVTPITVAPVTPVTPVIPVVPTGGTTTPVAGSPILTPATTNTAGNPDLSSSDPGTSANGGGGRSTYRTISDPIIPQITLIGSVGNHFIIADQHATIVLPSNLFSESDPSQQLSYEAGLPDGSSLPPWLTFDVRNLTFAGTPPAAFYGAIDVVIVARDNVGNQASASFRILVGRKETDLLALINTQQQDAATPPQITTPPQPVKPQPAAAPAQPRNGAPSENGPQRNNNAQPPARPPVPTKTGLLDQHRLGESGPIQHASIHQDNAGYSAKSDGILAGRTGFSEQLRSAGQIGRLTQARALLKALERVIHLPPAA